VSDRAAVAERGAFARRRNGGYVLRIAPQERALVVRLLDELGELLTAEVAQPAAARLFPVVHPDDPEGEAEYQRLMRDELIASRLAGIADVKGVLDGSAKKVTFSDAQLTSFMQALNGVRLVLGTILDVSEDDEVAEIGEHVPEYQLYAYLSWLLDSAVVAASGS
jgi:Domain of unknown function (DUF2017)